MKPTDVPLPERIRNLSRDVRGYPVPFVVMVLPDGKPDFTVHDEAKRRQCIRESLCPICGGKLDYWLYFIGGPKSFASRCFSDPAMHEECARYSAAVCPFIRNEGFKYRAIDKVTAPPGVTIKVTSAQGDRRPERMGIFVSRKYETVRTATGILVKAAPWKSVEWIAT